MNQFRHILCIAVLWTIVKAVCERDTLTKIASLWKGKEPDKIMQNWVGKTTHVWMSPSFQRSLPGLFDKSRVEGNIACYQSVVDPNKVSTTDYVTLKNKTLAVTKYFNVMEWPGRVTIIESEVSDTYLYLTSANKGVYGYFYCDPDPDKETSSDPGVGIRVVNYDRKDKDQAKNIESAREVLNSLNFRDAAKLGTDC